MIGMRAGDSSGVASKPPGVLGAGGACGVGGVGARRRGGDRATGARRHAVAAGAVATGTMTARPARTAPKAARRARADERGHGREDEPTEARYADAWLRRKSRSSSAARDPAPTREVRYGWPVPKVLLAVLAGLLTSQLALLLTTMYLHRTVTHRSMTMRSGLSLCLPRDRLVFDRHQTA